MREREEGELPQWIVDNVPEELVASSLFRFEVLLQVPDPNDPDKRQKVTVDLLSDLDLDFDDLEEQMADLPSIYMWWSAIYSEVRLGVAVAERNLKVRRGQALKAANEECRNTGVKLSADQIKTIIESDDLLVKADMKLQKANMLAGKLYHMLKAMEMKTDIARSLAGFKKRDG